MQEASDAHSKTADSDTVCSFAMAFVFYENQIRKLMD